MLYAQTDDELDETIYLYKEDFRDLMNERGARDWNTSDLTINDVAQALKQAMLETLKKYSDPAKWASFVCFGTPY